ncbi:MAG: VWA domain-containing protein [Myxococcales bacterium]|nr:VWA domain-containing protein [Myxococcales bacterium]
MQYWGIDQSLFLTLAGALIAALFVMYLFKLRQRRLEVPFSPVWRQVLTGRPVRSAWQRIKRWLSLLLHVCVVVLLLLALRDPRPLEESADVRHVLLLVDGSASMTANDGPAGRDRMEQAREIVAQVVSGLDEDDQVMVLLVGSRVRTITPFVRPSAELSETLQTLRAGATSADWDGALDLANRSASGRTRPELVIITDGALDEQDLAALQAFEPVSGAEVRFGLVGGDSRSVAVTAFNVRPYPDDRRHYEVFVELVNGFDRDVSGTLQVIADGRVVERESMAIEAGGAVRRTYPDLASGGRELEAHFALDASSATDTDIAPPVDPFPLDDSAYAVLPTESNARVLLVADDNLFLEAPLLMNQNVQLERVRPANYAPERSERVDLTVFSGPVPAHPGIGNYLYVAPSGEHSPWEVLGERSDPIIDRFERSDPLMRWMTGFTELNIGRLLRLDMGPDDVVVARTIRGDAAIARRQTERGRQAVLAFRIEESDIALRPEYPLLMVNFVDWLTGTEGAERFGDQVGTARRVRVPAELRAVYSVGPDEAVATLPVSHGTFTFYPSEVGFYRFYAGQVQPDGEISEPQASDLEADAVASVGVSLFNQSESHIEQTLPDLDTLPFSASMVVEQESQARRVSVPIWGLLALAAVVLLVLEWATFHRRVTV